MFFVFWGEHVLFRPGSKEFAISFPLLTIGTAVSLMGFTWMYSLLDRSQNAYIKFGIIGTLLGLLLDTITIAQHHFVFPNLKDNQMVSFAAWMTLAYALYLLIPLIFQKYKNKTV